ncbi:TPA: hypothetical protein N0F65_000824 [Lagenidium giganteum]|uniref:Uncharacterized protein n=1 Tax=Lagenidium giganteum TaxID=4803 RepID=A0AAV2YZ99_9STRA|nr:TPA: hypothetical protein N0F65_000824 [Lagenidium giganteum]
MSWIGNALCMYFANGSKNGQSGERPCDPRHVYANPLPPQLCPILASMGALKTLPVSMVPRVARKLHDAFQSAVEDAMETYSRGQQDEQNPPQQQRQSALAKAASSTSTPTEYLRGDGYHLLPAGFDWLDGSVRGVWTLWVWVGKCRPWVATAAKWQVKRHPQ